MNLPISIIVSTYPPKTRELKYVLKALQVQTNQDFEIIIVNDGDDDETKKIIKSYSKYLDIKYFSRQNDMCPSRSRNTGAKNSSFDHLIFIDSDILLNPKSLEVYLNFFQENLNKNISIWGKVGHSINNHFAQSDKDIADFRPIFNDENLRKYIENNFDTILFPCKQFLFGFSGNFGIRKDLFFSTNGFNENFVKWGWEDLDFAFHLYKKNIHFHFDKNIWGEHLRHEKKGEFYIIDNNNYVSTDNFRQTIKLEAQKYYCADKNFIIKEWEKVISFCNEKEYAERCLKEFLLKRKILDEKFS